MNIGLCKGTPSLRISIKAHDSTHHLRGVYEHAATTECYRRSKKIPALCTRKHGDEGVYPPRSVAGVGHDGGSWRGKRIPGSTCGDHNRRDISRGSDCHGRIAGLEGIAA